MKSGDEVYGVQSGELRVENAFLKAVDSAENFCENLTRVGTISEKLLHRVLKFYIEPNSEFHEIPVLGSVADILNSRGITEVQTRSFEKLLPKLEKFLPEYPVELVHPLCSSRYVNYIDRDSGQLIQRRKSPKCDGVNRAATELYKIAKLIPNENLTVRLVFLDFEDFRYKIEKKAWRSSSENLIRRTPTGIAGEIVLKRREDYRIFLPDALGEEFTASELGKLIKLDSRRTHNTLSLLLTLGLIERRGSVGRAYIYGKTE